MFKSQYKKELKKAIETVKQALIEKEIDLIGLNTIYDSVANRDDKNEQLIEQSRKNIEIQQNNIVLLRNKKRALEDEYLNGPDYIC